MNLTMSERSSSVTADDGHMRCSVSLLQKYKRQHKLIDLLMYTDDSEEDDPLFAHQLIIGCSSEYFYKLLNGSQLVVSTGNVLEMNLEGIKRRILGIIVDAIYCGEIKDLNSNNVIDVLEAVQEFQLDWIKIKCEEFIKEKLILSPENCCDVLCHAHRLQDENLIQRTIDFLVANLDGVKDVTRNNPMRQLNGPLILVILQKGLSKVSCIPDLLSFIVDWVKQGMHKSDDTTNELPPLEIDIIQITVALDLHSKYEDKIVKCKFLSELLGLMTESPSSSSNEPDTEPEFSPTIISCSSLSRSDESPSKSLLTLSDSEDSESMRASIPTSDAASLPPPTSVVENTIIDITIDDDDEGYEDQGTSSSFVSPSSIHEDEDSMDNSALPSTVQNDEMMIAQDEEEMLPTFFYIAGNNPYSRLLKTCNLMAKECCKVSKFPLSNYCDNRLVYQDGRVFVIGGQDGELPTAEVSIYDVKKKTWSTGPSMTEWRCEFNAIFMEENGKGFIYSIGGDIPVESQEKPSKGRSRKKSKTVVNTDYEGTNSVERLQIYPRKGNHRWHTVDFLKESRHNSGVTVSNGKIYVVGGNAGSPTEKMHASNTVECFDSSVTSDDDQGICIGEWSYKCPMKTPRIGPFVVAVNGRIYVMGGGKRCFNEKRVSFDSVEIYDVVDDCWRPGPPMNKKRQFFDGFLHGNYIYVVGGDEKGRNTIERLDLRLNRWFMVSDDDNNILDARHPIWTLAKLT